MDVKPRVFQERVLDIRLSTRLDREIDSRQRARGLGSRADIGYEQERIVSYSTVYMEKDL